jgi:arylsulfatase A
MPIDRRDFVRISAAGLLSASAGRSAQPQQPQQPPNIVLIYVDDMGYGDLSCYGSGISTPNIDRLASEGMRFTHYYSASPVCSPSRAALMTGRYPVRVGVPSVLTPADTYGLPITEMTMGELVKTVGYRTACVGKWHLGDLPQLLPPNRGFDEYYGIPYSNDQFPSILIQNTHVIEEPVELDSLTERYTERAIDFMQGAGSSPFFLYFAHTFPHIPLAASSRFLGKSGLGLYGDVVQEIDWSTGQIASFLRDANLDTRTLVIFSSDNGPWFQGSAGRLRGRKGETWDGGMRMPMIARFPGTIQPGFVSDAVTTAMDIFPTVAGLTGSFPANPTDGVDIWPILTGATNVVPRDIFLYMNGWHVQCARLGQWKLHVSRYSSPPWVPLPDSGIKNLPLPHPELYDLYRDVDESYDVSDQNPDVVATILDKMKALIATFPQNVQDEWQKTTALRVAETPPGAVPIEQT